MPDIGLRIALVMMDLFVALIAIGGGIALSAGLERSRFSSELLVGTPFRTYVIPGLILAIAVGGSAALATVAAINGRHEGGVAATVAGPLLIGYIGGEMVLLNDDRLVSGTEEFYLAIGLMMTVLGLIAWHPW